MSKKEQLWTMGWNSGIHSKRVFTIKLAGFRLELWKDLKSTKSTKPIEGNHE